MSAWSLLGGGRQGLLLAALAWLCVAGAPAPRAQSPDERELDFGDFYEALAPYGDWVEYGDYGWVWWPADVPEDWQPYTYGQWVLTEDEGWLWLSDFDWGWAPFHYGRWFWDDEMGWLWVPGYEWASAWVTWRAGDGWIGWAPLPPGLGWEPGDLDPRQVLLDDWIEPHAWVFVDDERLIDEDLVEYLAPPERCEALVHYVPVVREYTVVQYRVTFVPIIIRYVEQKIGRALPRHRIERLHERHERRDDRLRESRDRGLSEGRVEIYRPAIVRRTPRVTPDRLPPSDRQLAREARDRELVGEALREHHERDQAERREAAERARREEAAAEVDAPEEAREDERPDPVSERRRSARRAGPPPDVADPAPDAPRAAVIVRTGSANDQAAREARLREDLRQARERNEAAETRSSDSAGDAAPEPPRTIQVRPRSGPDSPAAREGRERRERTQRDDRLNDARRQREPAARPPAPAKSETQAPAAERPPRAEPPARVDPPARAERTETQKPSSGSDGEKKDRAEKAESRASRRER